MNIVNLYLKTCTPCIQLLSKILSLKQDNLAKLVNQHILSQIVQLSKIGIVKIRRVIIVIVSASDVSSFGRVLERSSLQSRVLLVPGHPVLRLRLLSLRAETS